MGTWQALNVANLADERLPDECGAYAPRRRPLGEFRVQDFGETSIGSPEP